MVDDCNHRHTVHTTVVISSPPQVIVSGGTYQAPPTYNAHPVAQQGHPQGYPPQQYQQYPPQQYPAQGYPPQQFPGAQPPYNPSYGASAPPF
jgi:hypothetical protein